MSPAAGRPSGRIVAELGRPETPEETRAREAESSRLYRARKTFPNLIWALIVSVIVVAALVWLVPRDDSSRLRPVDVATEAAAAQPGIDVPLAVPAVPDGWTANTASLRRGADRIVTWNAGYVIPDERGTPTEYALFTEAIGANPTWIAEQVGRRPATGSLELAGRTWEVYDATSRPESETGNAAYGLVAELAGATVVVTGSRSPEAVQTLAAAVAASMGGAPSG